MNPIVFFAELKRRNVYKVAVAYAVVGWLGIQIAMEVFPFFEIPNWGVRLVVLLIIIGFPVALILVWAFELTAAGIKQTESVAPQQKTSRGRVWIYVIMIGGAGPTKLPATMPVPRKVGSTRAANWKLSSKNSRKTLS